MILTAALRYMRPPSPLAGRLAGQSLLFALGDGAFMTGSAVFFTQIVGLSAAQVGLGLTCAGIAAFLAAVPMGKLVDRFGPKRMWAVSAVGQAAMFALWPFITDFPGFLMMAVGMEVISSLGHAAHGAYTIDVLPPGERVTSRAYMYSALNLGFTLGSFAGGIALAFHSNDVLHALPWFTSLVFVVNAVAVTRLPRASHDNRTAAERKVKIPGPGPMRNPGWILTSFLSGVFWTNQVLLNLVIPLWLVEQTDAPRVLLAFLFGTNTVMCIFLPMVTARGVTGLPTALRAIRISSTFFVISCVITLATHDTVGWITIALVWLGHVTVTGAELYLSAADWTFDAELMDPRQRGAYQGTANLSGTLGKVWAPAVYTFLAMNWGATGWLLIAGIIVIATIAIHPSTRLARRFLETHVPAEALAEARASAPAPEPAVPAALSTTADPEPDHAARPGPLP
ncbi:MFS transporter [Actinoplanes derwentensis]|uniref:Major Facilitator Superfamily protein n=1 Tax=Actinoplanes derwentensis TaxID=113562 RepID=A0A1H1Y5N7_9ACTN|nr:MFS transporter [Actinoplanes derwentensis]GID86710.1 MFS transporter [Actinoplanes derwentensis]SDT16808.1 Major Facilitator Superfamily protein [Actinoplanes derwentensis]